MSAWGLFATGDHILRATVVAVGALCIGVAGLRWLRVAQREHYLFDGASRFAVRWWTSTPLNVAGLGLGLAGLILASRWPAWAFAPAAVVAGGPVGLTLRGRTAPLAWTRRLRTLAVVWGALEAGVVAAGTVAGQGPVAVALAMEAVDVGLGVGLEEGLRLEAVSFGICAATEDCREGTRAFLEKRKPAFAGK